MIDPILSLSFSMHSNKGVYALLLGSGVSRAASIPTGWEVTLDLIKKLAHVKNENCEPDPVKWYEETFSEEADYSKVLNLLAKTPSERSQLLKGYFEPTEEERQQKLKTPTEAHRAVASLVVNGLVKIIVTTNFDRLMEKALEDVGIVPIVISTIDTVLGAPPIVHTPCTIIKVHGDYLDTRIKNTPEELSTYDEHLNTLLDRVFDEFGLIICGWSGEWDTALREAILRCKSRRFSTYWTAKDPLSTKAKELADFRKAEIININSADSFFVELSEKLTAINDFERPHPLSVQSATATVKKYLEEEKYKIRLRDLVTQETEKLFENISRKIYPANQPRPNKDDLLLRVKQYEAKTEILQAIMITGGHWGGQNESNLFVKSLERLTDHQKDSNGFEDWINLGLYPALLLLCSTCLAALASNNHQMFADLLLKPQNKHGDRGKEPLFLSIFPHSVISQEFGRLLPGMERRHTPTSDYLVETLKPAIKEYIPDSMELEKLFDRLEYMLSLTILDHLLQTASHDWCPIGRFGWRTRGYGDLSISNQIESEIEREKENWKYLKVGFFGGSLDRAINAQRRLSSRLQNIPW